MSAPQRVLLAGGRSGGHIYALVAVARVLQQRHPDIALRFVGEAGRMEEELVPREGYALTALRMPPTAGSPLVRALGLTRWLGAYADAKRLVAEFRPDAVVASGGQVCLPVLLAARGAGVRSVLLEPNAIPGKANRVSARWARPDRIGIFLPQAREHFPADAVVEETGYPLRPAILEADRAAGVAALGLDPARRTLLIFGGSQGSGKINDVAVELLPKLGEPWASGWQVVHIGGWINARGLAPEAARELAVPYHYHPYLHEMEHALAATDLAVGRAGATSLAELAALGKPMVLVPLPGLADNHQWYNARWPEEAGAAVVVRDEDLSADRLHAVLQELADDPGRLADMGEASRRLGKPDAAERVADLVAALVG